MPASSSGYRSNRILGLLLCGVLIVPIVVGFQHAKPHRFTVPTSFAARKSMNDNFSFAARKSINDNFSFAARKSSQDKEDTDTMGEKTVYKKRSRVRLRGLFRRNAKDAAEKKSSWLGWMSGGKPRGTSDMKLREAEELGGIPRNDRYSSQDWFHNTLSLPNSSILRSIRSPVIFMTAWSTFISILYIRLLKTNPLIAKCIAIPSTTPHSLTMSAMSLLLVFRTNTAYQRFAEGRKIWEDIINSSRDLHRMCMLYEPEMGIETRRRMQRLIAAFPYLLRHRIRPNLVMRRVNDDQYKRDPVNTILLYQDSAAVDDDDEAAAIATQEETLGMSRRKTRPLFWVDKRTLPWRLLPSNALQQCARAQNRPLWVCDRMSKEIRAVPTCESFMARERLNLIGHVEKLSHCIGACERIHQTAVPLNYARHSLRGLTLWLITLPFALVSTLGPLIGPVLFLVSWLLFGVYEIGYSIEDPFQGTLRLSILCDTIRRDVLADEFARATAFNLKEKEEEDDDDDDKEESDEDECVAEISESHCQKGATGEISGINLSP